MVSPGSRGPESGSLLTVYYENFLSDQDIGRFGQQVSARYSEGTLARLLDSGDVTARRASVLALGLCGTIASNPAMARALRDDDATVRALAGDALWAIWFRADTPENNATLEQVQRLIGQQRPEDAIRLATKLIGRAPQFAEAYNQRAIAHFLLGHFQESAEDCERVLEHNPYHFGALGGLAQCQLRLEKRQAALTTLRRALRLQPFSHGLRQAIAALEAGTE
jgi:tetratricopeptide (TPR) repeat protein